VRFISHTAKQVTEERNKDDKKKNDVAYAIRKRGRKKENNGITFYSWFTL
jgi:hypothetical protein